MLIKESTLRRIIREEARISLREDQAIPSPSPSLSVGEQGFIKPGNGGYEYKLFSNGKIQIVKRNGKAYPTPVTLNQQQAKAVAKELIELGNKGSIVTSIANGTLAFNPGAAAPAASAAVTGAAAGSTSPGVLQAMSTFLSSVASKLTIDILCAPSMIPLWVYPFISFLVLRKTPLVLTNSTYLQSLHRICDIARARGSANLAGPGDIATAQDRDPVYKQDKQGIVGADVSFSKDWSKGYDYTSTNPYMHIAMSLTNFSFSGPTGGPYMFNDTYDFNEPGKVDAPLGNPNYMLQQSLGRSQILKTVWSTLKAKGTFGGIEDLMRYYEATLNYGGFQITGTTEIPAEYVRPNAKVKK